MKYVIGLQKIQEKYSYVNPKDEEEGKKDYINMCKND